ncbi:hypothetical protein FG87_31605 [Nocardia vulneris]|uniref:Uncharacterized protein n=1 Tax=Nocardia vulneris TaxID=1141657 RepID=A0ABR4Z7N7_9NOCA|nr:hypothetical protein FG87_31605 [Nocardia vulneris]
MTSPSRSRSSRRGFYDTRPVEHNAVPFAVTIPAEQLHEQSTVAAAEVGDRSTAGQLVAVEHTRPQGAGEDRHGPPEKFREFRIGGDVVEIRCAEILLRGGLPGPQGVRELGDRSIVPVRAAHGDAVHRLRMLLGQGCPEGGDGHLVSFCPKHPVRRDGADKPSQRVGVRPGPFRQGRHRPGSFLIQNRCDARFREHEQCLRQQEPMSGVRGLPLTLDDFLR